LQQADFVLLGMATEDVDTAGAQQVFAASSTTSSPPNRGIVPSE
jgi:hypothetical protein